MDNLVDIKMGELTVGQSPAILATGGIGSCVAVCVYHARSQKGGLAHIMLPGKMSFSDANDVRCADIAIAKMIQTLEAQGVARTDLVAKIVGGANMFPDIQGRSQKVGEKNIESVRQILSDYQIPLAGEEIGGTAGRAVTFDLTTGIVTIRMTL